VARVLIVAGLVLVAAGLLIKLGVPIGRLPGDLVIRRGNATIYIPIVTSILASIILTVILAMLRK
jgi:hypothetical protein